MWNMTDQEIALHRRQEQAMSAQCKVFDAVALFLVNRDPFTAETLRDAVAMAVRRFEPQGILPGRMIATLVHRQINAECQRRVDIARLPPPPRKDRFGRPIQQKQTVVCSPLAQPA